MSEKFLERNTIVSAFVPVDMQDGANAGDWVSLAEYEACVVVLFKAAGTAGDDPVFKLQQSTTNTGGDAKDLNFTVVKHKIGAQTSTVDFTRVTQTAATSYTNTSSAEAQAIIAVEIEGADLDVANGFDHIQLSVADTGSNAQLGCGFYILLNSRYAKATPPDAQ